MATRQENHVTRQMRDRLAGYLKGMPLDGLPHIPTDLVKALQGVYPPKCYTASESLEEHLLYAGAVSLVERLATISAAQHDKDTPEDIFEREDEEVANITISREDQA